MKELFFLFKSFARYRYSPIRPLIICLTDHIVHGVMQSIVRGIKIIDIHVAYVLACVIDIVVSHEKRFIFYLKK